jgi:tetratricopeptide (TPR) repeat protein
VRKLFGLLALLAIAGSSPSHAHDGDVDAARSIDALYFHRDVPGNLEKSIQESDAEIARQAQYKQESLESMFLWMRCRSLIRRGEKRDKKSDKLSDYDLARQDCEKSVQLQSADANGHFWYGVAMGRWGETKGIFKSLFLVKPIRHEMEETLKIDPKYAGAHRVLGEMLWQIPGIAGGDKKKALAEYETAVKLAPNHSTNYPVLAEAYIHFDRKDDAIRTLNAVLAITAPDDPAELPGDVADAKKLLAKLTAK